MFEIKEISNVDATARWGFGAFASVLIGVGGNAALWLGILPAALAC